MEQTMGAMKPLNGKKRAVILGTDWHTDCDDAVAVRILAWARRRGLVDVLGVSIDSASAYSVASMKAFLEHEAMGDVPVALDHGAFDYGGAALYQPRLAMGRDAVAENRNAEDAVRLYRRALAGADERVDLIEIGFSQVLAALLSSPADDLSPLCGIDLVREKVSHLWMMGGNWQSESVPEFNFSKTQKARDAICAVLRDCPVPITFLGFEVGESVPSGGALRGQPWDDPLRDALRDYGAEEGRSSWDPLLVLLACVGDAAAVGFDLVRGIAEVDPASGSNRFTVTSEGKHSYVVKAQPDEWYTARLDAILVSYGKEMAGA